MQILLNGLVAGLPIAVLALAFALVYVPTRIFHLSLGAVACMAPYVTLFGMSSGWSPFLSVLLSLAVTAILSFLCELLNHWLLERRGGSPSAHMISSLAINIILVQVIVLLWGSEGRYLRRGIDRGWSLAGISITNAQILAAAVSTILLAGTFIWLRRTESGLRLRALASNPTETALRGFNVRRIRLVAFAISGALAAGSTLLTAYDIGFGPYGGLPALLVAIVAALIGGRASFSGAALGGLLLGVLRTEVTWFLSARWQEAATFLLLVTFLVVRPEGLLGSRQSRLEATE